MYLNCITNRQWEEKKGITKVKSEHVLIISNIVALELPFPTLHRR